MAPDLMPSSPETGPRELEPGAWRPLGETVQIVIGRVALLGCVQSQASKHPPKVLSRRTPA
jgi:hypothetical protein